MLARGSGALFAVALVPLRVGIAGARTTPLKLSHPDIAYLAASAVSARALAGVSAGVQAFVGAAAGAAPGFLLGVGGGERVRSRARRPRWRSQVRRWLRRGCAWLGRRFRPAGKRRLERMAHGCGRIRSRGVCRFLVWRRLAAGADALLAPATFAVLSVGDSSSSPSRRSPLACLRRAWI
ncbi:MAG: hypothetical protein ACLR3C_14635 [Eggerthella lenta]